MTTSVEKLATGGPDDDFAAETRRRQVDEKQERIKVIMELLDAGGHVLRNAKRYERERGGRAMVAWYRRIVAHYGRRV